MNKDIYANYPILKKISDEISTVESSIDDLKNENIKLKKELIDSRNKYFDDYQDRIIKYYEQKKELKKQIKNSINDAKYEYVDLNNIILENENKLKDFIKNNKPNHREYNSNLKSIDKKYNDLISSNKIEIKKLKTKKNELLQQLRKSRYDLKDELAKNKIIAIDNYKNTKILIKQQKKNLRNELKKELAEIKNLKSTKEKNIKEYGYTFIDKNTHIKHLYKRAIKNYKYNLVNLKNKQKEKKSEINIAEAKENFISKDKVFNYFDTISKEANRSNFSSCLIKTFIFLIPIILIGQIFIFINNILLNYYTGGLLSLFYKSIDFILIVNQIKALFDYFQFLLTSTSLFMCIIFSYVLANTYNISKRLNIITSVLIFFIASSKNFRFISFQNILGNQNMIISIIVPIVVTLLFVKLKDILWIKIKFKIKWDKQIIDLINSSIEFFIVMMICSSIIVSSYFLLNYLVPKLNIDKDLVLANGSDGWSIASFLELLIQIPIAYLKKVLPLLSIIVLLLILSISYYFGFNGSMIVGSLLWTKFNWLDNNGTSAFNFYNNIINIIYIQNGGIGGTISLLIAILIFSKRKSWVNISKISALFVIFQINEMLLFGLPIVFNPILVIPFMLAPIVAILITYISISTGIVPPPHIDGTFVLPWTTPPIIGALWITRWDYRAGLLSFTIIIVQFLIYTPFVLLDNKIYMLNRDNIFNQKLVFKNKAKKILEENKLNYQNKKYEKNYK